MRTFSKNEDFIFEIIHDLKAPVMSMDFALKNADRDSFLDEIYKINRHNLNYIENIMSGYCLSKGRYCPKFEIVNLLQIVKEELSVLSFLISEKNLRTSISLDKTDEVYITTDKYLIRQIILNLLTNAVKYTPNGETIRIVFEKHENMLSICFNNVFDENKMGQCSSKLGLEIVKKKLKVLKGKLKITKNFRDICYNISFEQI